LVRRDHPGEAINLIVWEQSQCGCHKLSECCVSSKQLCAHLSTRVIYLRVFVCEEKYKLISCVLIDRKIILSLLGKNSIKEFRETMTLKVQNKVNNAMILLFSQ
jgi:hypothetical protein